MTTVTVRGLTLGEGRPKIILPITGENDDALLRQAEEIKGLPCDMAEWRMDWYEHALDTERLLKAAALLRKTLGEMPVLATFRTAKEGGEREITSEAYQGILSAVTRSGLVDLVDIEAFSGDELVAELIALCRERGVKTVLSNHDFQKTPEQEEILRRLKKMEALGADIPKIALMPQRAEDVIALLSATLEAARTLSVPVITMSMGKLGAISRLAGETFGSCATFGSPGRASAPGQVAAAELERILTLLHG